MPKISLPVLLIVIALSSSNHVALASNTINTTSNEQFILYLDVEPVNRTESLEKIKAVPIKMYEFKYDKVKGRRQMGVFGADAHKFFPESVEVVQSYSIPNKERGQSPIVLNNFPIVDKTIIFMHGLAALQELLFQFDAATKYLEELKSFDYNISEAIAKVEREFSREASAEVLKKKELAQQEAESRKLEMELDQIKLTEEKRRIATEVENEKKLLDYEEKLAKERMALQEQLTKESMQASLKLEKELADRKEQLRRENAEKLQAKRSENAQRLEEKKSQLELEKIRAEVEAKAEQERANEDVIIRKLQAQARLDTERITESIRVVSDQLVFFLREFLSRPQQIGYVLAAISSVLAIFYAFRQFIAALRDFVQARLGRPSLVRETSYSWSIFPKFLRFSFGESLKQGSKRIEDYFANVVLCKEDRQRVLQLALSTRNTRRTSAPYRHVLLHGPPGTGKTLIARQLAKSSGMDYAVMSGGDVGSLGDTAVDQLHALFQWASRSPRGLLLFIDEAEAFLSTRRGGSGAVGDADAHMRHALNALLYQTGTQSQCFMMVLATNRPEDLDPAVLDRVDVSLYIGLPSKTERITLTRLYMQQHVIDVAEMAKKAWLVHLRLASPLAIVAKDCIEDAEVEAIATRCAGFSGREIAKLFVSMGYTMLLADKRTLTKALLDSVVDAKVAEHMQKVRFYSVKELPVTPFPVPNSSEFSDDALVAVASGGETIGETQIISGGAKPGNKGRSMNKQ